MKIRNWFRLFVIASIATAGCADPGTDALRDDPPAEAMADADRDAGEPGRARAAVETTSCGSGANGGFHYCSAACPCDAGEGDCDSDSECTPGLTCVKDVGPNYGWDHDVDVCEDTCHPSANGGFHYCSAACPCDVGEGDCDSNGECLPGLTCVKDVGPNYGWDHDVDVCEDTCHPSANGGSNYCSPTCPCASGEGDCDGNSECLPGLTCVKNVGARYGWDADVDVCEGQCDPTGETCAPGCPCAPQGTSLFLQVLDLDDQPIPTAGVTLDGSLHATDGVGRILFENLSPGRVVARVEAYGFAPASVAVELAAGAHAGAEIRLRPLGPPIPFDAGSGATIEQDAVRVTIPPDSLVDYLGQPVTGTVEATIVPLDPTQATSDSLPGPLQGLAAGTGAPVELESVIMAEVTLWQDGLPVQLAPGATATLEMLLPDSLAGRYQAGESIPAWWLDLDAGVWKEEGAGFVVPSAAVPGKLAWMVEVGHFTWWNCDAPWTYKHCYTVVVQDASGNLAPNMWLSAEGVSYTGSSWWRYAPDGQQCIDIKRDETADILVGVPSAPFVTQRVTGSGPAADCAGNGAACTLIVVTAPVGAICAPGASEPCPYTGPAGTEGVGVCQAGARQCNATGTEWSGCVGQVVPSVETCTNPFDDDCDGATNEGLNCGGCSLGQQSACYTGPPDTLGVGICRSGKQSCGFTHVFGPCVGDIVPQLERCATPEDDDCDGTAPFEVWEGDFVAWTPEQIEQLRGCTGIRGGLDIIAQDADEAADLSALDSIQFVDGSFFLYAPQVPLDSSVLPSLVTVGGYLLVEYNRAPDAFDPFPSLVSVGGSLYLFGIRAEVVTGLRALRTVGGNFTLHDIEATRIDDLAPSLEAIGSGVNLYDVYVDAMTDFGALQSADDMFFWHVEVSQAIDLPNDLHSIESFEIDHSAVQLQGPDALQSIGHLWINESIVQLQGLDALQSIGSLTIDESVVQLPPLPSVSALGGLKITGSDVRLANAFPAVTAMTGTFYAADNDFLQLHDSFQALESVSGSFFLADDAGDFTGSFGLLGSVDGNLEIYDTPWSQVPGFPSLTTVGQLVIHGNDALTSLTGFERLAQAWNGIWITDNPALDVCHVENFEAMMRANGYEGPFEAHDNGPDGGACE